jgi:hypothetical protein
MAQTRELATHWVLVGPEGEITVEKFRPMLRALFPNLDERGLTRIAQKVYMARDEGYETGSIQMYRRVSPGIYKTAATHIKTGKKNNPFLEEAAFFAKFRGRKCLT